MGKLVEPGFYWYKPDPRESVNTDWQPVLVSIDDPFDEDGECCLYVEFLGTSQGVEVYFSEGQWGSKIERVE